MAANYLTAIEHESIPITELPTPTSLTPAEAERLAVIGRQRRGFCELGVREVKLAQYCGIVSLGTRVLEILPKTQQSDSPKTCRGC